MARLVRALERGFPRRRGRAQSDRSHHGLALPRRQLRLGPARRHHIGQRRGTHDPRGFPGIEDAWVDEFADVVETGEPMTFIRQVGTLARWYEGRAFPHGSERFGVIFLEVTERVEADARRNGLLELGERLRADIGTEAIAKAGAAVLGRVLGVGRVGYGTVGLGWRELRRGEGLDRCGIPDAGRPLPHGRLRPLRRGPPAWTDGRHPGRARGPAHRRLRHGPGGGLRPHARQRAHRREGQDGGGALRERRPPAFLGRAGSRVHPPNRRADPPGRRAAACRGAAGPAEPRTLPPPQEHDGDGREHRAPDAAVRPGARAGGGVPEAHPGLASAHDLLLRKDWTAADLRTVCREVLGNRGRGPPLHARWPRRFARPSAALSASLLLHELATNAAKYGSLSGEEGQVELRWWIDGTTGEPGLVLRWREHGGPPVTAPTRKGFGSRLIRTGLVGTGEVDVTYDREGVIAVMRAPMVEVQRS